MVAPLNTTCRSTKRCPGSVGACGVCCGVCCCAAPQHASGAAAAAAAEDGGTCAASGADSTARASSDQRCAPGMRIRNALHARMFSPSPSGRSEEPTSELQELMRLTYAVSPLEK